MHGVASFWADRSLATNVVLAAYKGTAVEALTLLAKGTNQVPFAITGGETYHIAAAVPMNALGDVLVYSSLSQSPGSRAVPGNLLREPSWEGTAILEARYWKTSGGIGGAVNELGGCDGTTWPTLGGGSRIWQDIATVPGLRHSIRFAMRANGAYVGSGTGDGCVRVLWDEQEVGLGVLPAAELWPEGWGTFEQQVQEVMQGAPSLWRELEHIPMLHSGRDQETFWSYSLGPVFAEDSVDPAIAMTTVSLRRMRSSLPGRDRATGTGARRRSPQCGARHPPACRW